MLLTLSTEILSKRLVVLEKKQYHYKGGIWCPPFQQAKGSWGVPLVGARAVACNGDPASLARNNIIKGKMEIKQYIRFDKSST